MKSVDTNVVLRFLVRDDLTRATQARETIREGIFVSYTVLMETEWVLRSGYGWNRERIASALSGFVAIDRVTVSNLEDLRWALDRYLAGADCADMLHLIISSGHDAFVTFDRSIARKVGPHSPLPIEALK